MVAQQDCRGLFLQAIRDQFSTLKLHSDAMLIKKITEERVKDCSLQLFAYLTCSAGALNKNEYLALSDQVLRCLSKYVKNTMGLPVTLKTLMNAMSLMETAVDEAFPGYAASCLLRRVIYPTRAA